MLLARVIEPRAYIHPPLPFPERDVRGDDDLFPLGAPVWLEKGGADPLMRLMVAQDTGSAIKGAQRGDIFVGSGDEAGRVAAKLKDPGRLFVLLPIDLALELTGEAAER